ncbi:hypothetical protein P3440_22555, partial [Vibrio parahaemolyticus]|nr:hypothetical protein [Vibrio parahaemolyticus]
FIFRHVSCVRLLVLAIFVSEELSNVLALYRHEAWQQKLCLLIKRTTFITGTKMTQYSKFLMYFYGTNQF